VEYGQGCISPSGALTGFLNGGGRRRASRASSATLERYENLQRPPGTGPLWKPLVGDRRPRCATPVQQKGGTIEVFRGGVGEVFV
jgi:hypothetical protein